MQQQTGEINVLVLLHEANLIIFTAFFKTGQILFSRLSQKRTIMLAQKIFTVKAYKTQHFYLVVSHHLFLTRLQTFNYLPHGNLTNV